MHAAYVDCFVTLTKAFYESEDHSMVKFVNITYKELLRKYLGGRGAPSHCLNQQFFTTIFEECNAKLGSSLLNPLLKFILPCTKEKKWSFDLGEPDSEMSGVDSAHHEKKSSTEARSNHQRLLAIEILNSMVRASAKNEGLLIALTKNLDIISRVLVTVVKTSDSWQ